MSLDLKMLYLEMPYLDRGMKLSRALVVASCLAFGSSALAADVPFVRTTIDENPPTNPWFKMVGDLNGDGQLDLIVAGSNGPLVWYAYPDWTKNQIASSGWDGVNGEAVDLDGDGDIDIVMGGIVWFVNPRLGGGQWERRTIDSQEAHDIEVGDLDGDGRLDVVARDQSAFGATGNTLYLYRQTEAGGWTQQSFNCPHGEGLALADLDRDGDLDIVIGGQWYENGGGSFPLPWTARVYTTQFLDPDNKVIPADFNGDGRLDIALSPAELAGGSDRIAWYEGPENPLDSNWVEHVVVPAVETVVHGLVAADFDRDGDLDLAYAEMHQGADPDEVCVMLNLGTGAAWQKQVISTGGSHEIVAADIGNDGDVDILGANWSGSFQHLELWRNDLPEHRPLDSWQRHVIDPSRPAQAIFIGARDLNQDALPDIVTGAWWYQNPGSPGGNWTRRTIGSPLNNLAVIHDFDADGDPDLLGTRGVGSTPDARFAWARNNGSGEFEILTNISDADGDFLQGVAVGSFSSGGPVEVALSWHASNKGVQMLTVPPDAANQTWAWRRLSTASQDEQLSAGDLDLDGDLDLVMGTRWLRNDPPEWTPFLLNPTTGNPDRNRLADLNGDGRIDVIVGFEAISVAGKLAWYEAPADATATWQEHVIALDVVGPMSVDVADLDGDGDVDVVVGEHNLVAPASARLLIFENLDGAGAAWSVHVVHTGDEHHDGAQVVDIDGDGDLDIVSIGWSHPRVLLYENTTRTLVKLDILPSGPDVTLSWPQTSPGLALETAPDLAGGTWLEVTNGPLMVDDLFQVTLPVEPSHQYFRLK